MYGTVALIVGGGAPATDVRSDQYPEGPRGHEEFLDEREVSTNEECVEVWVTTRRSTVEMGVLKVLTGDQP